MKKKNMGIVVRCTAFIVVFCMFFSGATNLLMRHDDESNEIHAFYSEPKNSIDVLYIGSSPLLRGVSPMMMWNDHGFTGYVRASALQAPSVSYGLLAESLERQTPELAVLLCDNIFSDYDYKEREGDLRRGLDGMKMSSHKFRILQEIAEEDDRQTVLSYTFPLMRYHDRWKEIDLAEDEPEPLLKHSFKKGNVYLKDHTPQEYPANFMEPTGEAAPAFDADSKAYIEESLALCKEKDIPVLILHLPKMSWSYEQSMAVEQFAEENGAAYLDLDRAEYRSQLGLDPAVDYYDQGHMSLTGTKKVTDWLGNWLDDTYDLPDHRDDPAYEMWKEDYKLYSEKTGMK